MKRITIILVGSLLCLVINVRVVFASSMERLSFTVGGVSFDTSYLSSEYRLEKVSNPYQVTYQIIDVNNYLTVEKWVFIVEEISSTRNLTRSYTGIIGNYRYINYKTFATILGLTNTIQNEVVLEKYSYGSTAQINKVVYSTHMISGWSYLNFIEFNQANTPSFPVWGSFPCTQLAVDYTAVIEAAVDVSVSGTIGAELTKAKFSISGQVGTTVFYRNMIFNSYLIRVL